MAFRVVVRTEDGTRNRDLEPGASFHVEQGGVLVVEDRDGAVYLSPSAWVRVETGSNVGTFWS